MPRLVFLSLPIRALAWGKSKVKISVMRRIGDGPLLFDLRSQEDEKLPDTL